MYLFYLGNFNAPILFLGLVGGGIVVPGTVVINQLPVPLGYTCLNKRKEEGKKIVVIHCLQLHGITHLLNISLFFLSI